MVMEHVVVVAVVSDDESWDWEAFARSGVADFLRWINPFIGNSSKSSEFDEEISPERRSCSLGVKAEKDRGEGAESGKVGFRRPLRKLRDASLTPCTSSDEACEYCY